MSLLEILLFFFAAMAGGGINSVAGGGTFLTFPLLIWGGLSPLTANIMSTIALWPGSVSSVFGYRGQLTVGRNRLVRFVIASMLGSILGTAILLLSPEKTFDRLVPWLLLFATLIFTFGRGGVRWLDQFSDSNHPRRQATALALQFAIGVYGGYFGAGIGILMLAMLQVMGMDEVHEMNAFKTILGTAINAVAVLIFLFSGRVIWDLAVIMIAGAMFGGYVGARTALKVSPEKVRKLVSFIGFVMTAYFFLDRW